MQAVGVQPDEVVPLIDGGARGLYILLSGAVDVRTEALMRAVVEPYR